MVYCRFMLFYYWGFGCCDVLIIVGCGCLGGYWVFGGLVGLGAAFSVVFHGACLDWFYLCWFLGFWGLFIWVSLLILCGFIVGVCLYEFC